MQAHAGTRPPHGPAHPGPRPRPHVPLTSCSRLSLESSALCVDRAARTPRPSVTPVNFSPSAGGTWGVTGASALSKATAAAAGARHRLPTWPEQGRAAGGACSSVLPGAPPFSWALLLHPTAVGDPCPQPEPSTWCAGAECTCVHASMHACPHTPICPAPPGSPPVLLQCAGMFCVCPPYQS